ncbi:MFS transporter [Sporosarcina thermotolerans]|uniref:MFS transporter n=1 Tax=Sporosarcina thermotolerans TaxID=633404 RepID=A0AAW9A8A4_9BACL|nr:MFS transporter [Sporosarcina thermotolerans]MDW0116580.1 MFS transporter [Sporosarcina thermotolerans]WHT48798.1 MFS transporter [Sporosarcina thermotolerans]
MGNKKFNKTEKSWMFYDWANSAYSIIITTAVFPIYYKSVATSAGVESSHSTAYLAYTVAIATFILAMIGPILGTIADYKGLKKKFFLTFFLIGSLSTISLAFVPDGTWLPLLIIYTITAVGFHGANIFYDAFLVDVTPVEKMDEVSARGFGLGYIGSTIPFIISIAIILLADNGVIPLSMAVATKLAFVITGIWWFTFTIPMLKNVVQLHGIEQEPRILASGFRRLGETFKEIKKYKTVFIFLLAYFFYIDGVGTIISMSTAYGTDLGIGSTDLLIVLFVTQVVAAPFALIYGRLAKRFSVKAMLYVGIFVYIIVCIYAFFLSSVMDFWILAMLVATSQGGIQALSRSYFAQLVPKEKSNEFFGFYNIFGKFAAVMGPMLLGVTAHATGSSAYGVFSLVILFIIGGILLRMVPKPASEAV